MKGFVKNEGTRTVFILKRSVNPGFSISLDDAYLTVGKKSGKRRGPAFVNWLREAYFQDPMWAFYKDEGESYFEEEPLRAVASAGPAEGAGKGLIRRDEAQEKETLTAKRILDSEIILARQLIDKCKNKSTLRRALAATKVRTGKEAHMRYLIRRLEQVYF